MTSTTPQQTPSGKSFWDFVQTDSGYSKWPEWQKKTAAFMLSPHSLEPGSLTEMVASELSRLEPEGDAANSSLNRG